MNILNGKNKKFKQNYWNAIAKEGGNDKRLSSSLSKLEQEILSHTRELSNSVSSQVRSSDFKGLKDYVKTQILKLIENADYLSEKDRKLRLQEFQNTLLKTMDQIFLEGDLASISFDGYEIYTFFKALLALTKNTRFFICKEKIIIREMDNSNIGLFYIELKNETFRFFNQGSLGINVESIVKLLKCKVLDKISTKFFFQKKKMELNLTSKTHKSQIYRYIDENLIQKSEINVEPLRRVKYNFIVDISPEKFDYMLSNMGLLSEIVEIRISPLNICFMEQALNASSQIDWSNETITINVIDNEEVKKNHIKIAYNFLKMIKPLTSLIKKRDILSLYISDKEPFKIMLNLRNIGATIEYYLAQWIEEDKEKSDAE